MQEISPPPSRTLEDLSQALAQLVRDGSPAISRCAAWAVEHPQEMAFHSVRALADRADVNVNTVYRLALALGFPGFEACRRAFQAALRDPQGVYAQRAARLGADDAVDASRAVQAAAHANLEALFTAATLGRIDEAAERLAAARRVYCAGVRSCFSLAHYFAYTGRMAFANFERPLAEPGVIADVMAEAGPGDAVILISFSFYSVEVVRAHEAARARGVSIIAITDSYASPIAAGADVVFCLPMEGPQPLPSQSAGFTLIEAIIGEMIARSGGKAADRLDGFERELLTRGSYVRRT